MVIDIYIMRASGPSRALLMTIKQLNIPHNVKNVDLSNGEQLKPEYIKMNPAHCVPFIDDNGFILWESRAVMQYLCNQYAPNNSLYPKDPKKRAIVDRWLNFDISLSASQQTVLSSILFIGMYPPGNKVKAYKNNLKLLDQLICDNKYLTGSELTIADISVLATLGFRALYSWDLSDEYPNAKRWWYELKNELSYYDEINTFTKEELDEKIKRYNSWVAKQQQK